MFALTLSNFIHLLDEATADSPVTSPLYKFIDLVGPYAIGVLLVLSIVYSIILGVRYSKSDDDAGRKNAQSQLVNFVIGAVAIIILITILYAIRKPLAGI
ncbi:MAG: hypothetical protein IJS68_00175 [Clostridia bacterium]|nr:hypothetical protein [Clostridia bacterium]